MFSLPIQCAVAEILKNQSQFKAGRLSQYLPEWRKLTTDTTILQYVRGVRIEFKGHQPPPANEGICVTQQPQNISVVRTEIHKLLAKGVIVQSQHEPDEFISPIFLLPKKDGTYRMILNLKRFNQYVAYHHFKMDTLDTVIKLMKPGCYMASIDLRDAYYTVAIHPDHQKYLKFVANGVLYQYTCLPNGLASAPRIFTKLMKPVYSTLRSMGQIISGYIDDSYLQGDSVAACSSNVKASATLMNTVGFFLHPDKSVLSPAQTVTFLGFVLNSLNMTVSSTPEKISKTITCCTELLQTLRPTIFTGFSRCWRFNLQSTWRRIRTATLSLSRIDKISALKNSGSNYNAVMELCPRSINDLNWWVGNISLASKSIVKSHPSYIIKSDASTLGWGAVLDSLAIGGRWTVSESSSHINYLELLAAFFALKAF